MSDATITHRVQGEGEDLHRRMKEYRNETPVSGMISMRKFELDEIVFGPIDFPGAER